MAELELHPTVKPVQMIADAIRDVSGRGEIVLDLFGGSGSTLIAAEKTGRRAFLCELDPIYCDRIIRRWEAYAKDEAEQLVCGYAARGPCPEGRRMKRADRREVDRARPALRRRPATRSATASRRCTRGSRRASRATPRAGRRARRQRRTRADAERLKAIILEEAYRMIGVRDGLREVKVPMAQAIVRALAVNAVKGQQRAQRLFTELLTTTEREKRREHYEVARGLLDYKRIWDRELERRRAARHHRP